MPIIHQESIALVCEAGLYLAANSAAKAMVAVSTHGTTPRILASFRGNIPVVVACTKAEVYQRSTLYYSVQPIMTKEVSNPELIFRRVEGELKAFDMVGPGGRYRLRIRPSHPYPSGNEQHTALGGGRAVDYR